MAEAIAPTEVRKRLREAAELLADRPNLAAAIRAALTLLG